MQLLSAQSDIVINEFMASNDSLSGISDPAGGYPDWIEIHNRTNSTLDLEGYKLSDSYVNTEKFIFPAGSFIEAEGYVIVWADKDLDEEGFHADYRLNAGGERLILSDPNGAVLDSISFGPQETNVSFARIPNGTGEFTFRAPTFSFNNELTAIQVTNFIENASVFPNPTNGFLEYDFTISSEYEKKSDFSLRIYNLQGIFVKDLGQLDISNERRQSGIVDVRELSDGFYYLVLKTDKSISTQKFLLQK